MPGGTRKQVLKMPGKQKQTEQAEVIPVTLEMLNKEQKAKVELAMQEYHKMCLECFGVTRQGTLQKTDLPVSTLPDASTATDRAQF